MKKKFLLFFVGLLTISLVSAAIVNYLSNPTKAMITVGIPLVNEISANGIDGWQKEPGIAVDADGGVALLYIRTANLRDSVVNGVPYDLITGTNVTCADFDDILVDGVSKKASCVADSTTRLNLNLRDSVFPASTTEYYNITLRFNQGAIGTYSFESQVMVS